MAGQVEIKVANNILPMKRNQDDIWSRHITTDIRPVDYFFIIDGGKPLPDPRSQFQPLGVHGPSRHVDHSPFHWEDNGFTQKPLSSAVIYELHIGTFTPEGTFVGCINKLDYLKGLGITHIELMPVAEFSGERGWGYDGVDLFAPHHAYGGPNGLKRLINECHKKGIAVIIDVVYNHLGPEGNYLGQYGPYFTEKYKTPWGRAVNLDGPRSDRVRKFFIENAVMWFKHYHVDGLRLDACHSLYDMSALHFLEQLADTATRLETELDKGLVLIAETDLNDPVFVRSQDMYGYGLNAQWNDDFHHAVHSLLTGEKDGYYADFGKTSHLAGAMKDIYVYTGQYSKFRKKHHGRPLNTFDGSRFVVFSQNHDQVGNRAKGGRLCSLISIEKTKVAAALVLTSPFVPLLFQGEEWAASSPFLYFTSHRDPDLAGAVREGRKKEFTAFGWSPGDIPDPQDSESFRLSILRWDEQSTLPHAEILAWYKQLISLRNRFRSLSCGACDRITIDYSEERRWIHITRDEMNIFCNLSEAEQQLSTPKASGDLILTSTKKIRLHENELFMPGWSVVIIRYTL